MSEEEKELKQAKIDMVRLLAQQLVALNQKQYNDLELDEEKPVAYFDAYIDLLKKEVKNIQTVKPKLISSDKLNEERENLSEKELKALEKAQERMLKRPDSVIASQIPVATLHGNLFKENSIILRYRGKPGSTFAKELPFGVML